jgi:transposase
MILKEAPLPEDILRLGAEGVNQIWRNGKLRGSGLKRAEKVVEAAVKSIGYTSCAMTARFEIQDLLEDIERHSSRLEEIERMIEDALKEVPNVDKLLEIPGVGIKTVASFVAEIGDVSRFEDAKAIQKLSGLAIVSDDSGKHNGQSSISYRGRKHLRYTMYLGAVSVICHNDQFAEIYRYYRERKNNPLKKLQAVIAVACKLIRVFYTILTKGISYDGARMSADIRRLAVQPV